MTAATRMAQITEDQLREMIDSAVERKLIELLGDPDEGFSLKNRSANGSCSSMNL
ncbi:MAG TPA: hypothetical protein PLQ35_17690 [bacterium]|nr:hypothetical protein [bacterium]HQL64110.1 hypothetical protein [bacterium]